MRGLLWTQSVASSLQWNKEIDQSDWCLLLSVSWARMALLFSLQYVIWFQKTEIILIPNCVR
jgi:hypothetical protein